MADAENNLRLQLKEKCDVISTLNKKISSINSDNLKLKDKLSSMANEYDRIKNELSDLSKLNRNMVDTIRMLEGENQRCSDELCHLRKTRLLAETTNDPDYENVLVKTRIVNVTRKPQLLVIGGKDSIIGCGNLFKKYSNSKYDVNCQYKVGVLFNDIVSDCLKFSRSFNKNDFVILFLGCTNALRGKLIEKQHAEKLLSISRITNLVVTGSSFACNRKVLSSLIYRDNMTVQSVIHNEVGHSAYFSIDSFMRASERSFNGEPSYVGKMLLCRFLCAQLLCASLTNTVEFQSNIDDVGNVQSESGVFLEQTTTRISL